MEEVQREQEEALETLNWSVVFLLLLIVSILLSFAATSAQRDGLIRSLLCGQSEEEPDVFPLRWRAGLLSVFAAGFFAFLSRRTLDETPEEDCVLRRSARANALASALAFAATLIRLDDLKFIGASRQSAALEETLAPE